ncbi:MAG: hypothetical protein AB1801_28765, partial [Chloroflexota bacterium]
KAAPGGGMILSVGGGVSPDMPAENIDAMLAAARAWTPNPAQRRENVATPQITNQKPGKRNRPRRR